MQRTILLFVGLFVLTAATSLAQSTPGGIGATANLALWLDASEQTLTNPVTQWQDRSGSNVATVVNGNPLYIPNALNSRPVVRFDGNGDEVYTALSINADTWPELTVVAVYVPATDNAGSVWGEDNGLWDRFLTDITLTPELNSAVGAGFDVNDNYPNYNIANLFVPNTPSLTTVVYDEDNFNGTFVYINSANVSSFTSTATAAAENGTSTLYIGAIGSNGFRFNGDIAEVIVFRSLLNFTQRVIVENYLSAKYGLSISSSGVDLYNEDDLGFDYDVAGIGRSNGNQIQSDSRGTGIVRIWNASNLNNNEFLFWGHDNGILQAVNAVDVPPGVQARSARVWKVSEVNLALTPSNVGSVNISFDLSNLGPVTASDLRLIVDTDNDGIFSDETPIGSAVSLGNNEYAFMGITALADNVRFTIGTASVPQTPLPVEIESFDAVREAKQIKLNWKSVLEHDVASYTISRSPNGKNWHRIASVEPKGPGFYKYYDEITWNDNVYYKLSQTDLDGTEHLCDIVFVPAVQNKKSELFPNPTSSQITVVSDAATERYQVLNDTGVDFTSQTQRLSETENALTIDISQLPSGHYLLRTQSQSFHFMKSR